MPFYRTFLIRQLSEVIVSPMVLAGIFFQNGVKNLMKEKFSKSTIVSKIGFISWYKPLKNQRYLLRLIFRMYFVQYMLCFNKF